VNRFTQQEPIHTIIYNLVLHRFHPPRLIDLFQLHIFVKIKKSHKKVTFLVAQKNTANPTPMPGRKRTYFLSEKNKVTFLPIKNKPNVLFYSSKSGKKTYIILFNSDR